MSVLIVLTSSGRGGRELNTIRLISYLQERGMTVTVAVLDSGGYVTEHCRSCGFNCQSLGLWPSKLNILVVLWRFFLLLRKTEPEVVQVYGFIASMICRFTARPLRIKVVVGIVGTGHFIGIRPVMERMTKHLIDHYIANSMEGKNKLLEILHNYPARISVIHNGVPEIQVSPASEKNNCFIVGTVANLRPEKGYDVMLRALVQLKLELGEQVPLKYLIAGEGSLRKELTEMINNFRLSEQVSLLGMVENVSEMLGKLDLFILPSYTEGLPNALLEAMMAGRCVIATRVGGIPEIIEDGYNGLMVEPGDPQELSRAILKVVLTPQWRESMALQGRESAQKKFSLKQQAERTIGVWSAIYQENFKEVTR